MTAPNPAPLLFINASLVDGLDDAPREGFSVLVENGLIAEVTEGRSTAKGARIVDLAGKTLMPGLVDCHVHVIATSANLGANALTPDSLVAARSGVLMRGMLMRGFTTVRDVGGADLGLRIAIDEGSFEGPRLVICGKALSQTGGHTDYRGPFDERDGQYFTRRLGAMGRLCDGVDEVRRACRQEIKAGAQFIKIMANGGVSSPSDPIAFLGFSQSEMEAAVEEARNAQTYVSAHLYSDEAIARAVRAGVRSFEHCNLITPATALLAAQAGAMACPTLVTFEMLKKEGGEYGLPAESIAKIDDVRLAGLKSLEIMRDAGLPMAYGTDLLGPMHRHQSEEFVIRAGVLSAKAAIRSATADAARLLRMEGRIGCISKGAFGDLIVVDGNPLEKIRLLTGQGRFMPMIVKDGRVVKDELARPD
jgi:imidazolonepropionase-like amidohydrolase